MPNRPDPDPAGPEFGPGGYLPDRAARRARKIVLRERMGLQWPVAAVLAAVGVLIAGGIFLVTGTGPPNPPFAALAAIDDIDPRGALLLPAGTARPGFAAPDTDLVIVRAGGGVRVFATPGEVTFCADSGRLESADGGVWNTNGRRVGGRGMSLAPVAVQVYDGIVYVDQTTRGTPAPPEDGAEVPACPA